MHVCHNSLPAGEITEACFIQLQYKVFESHLLRVWCYNLYFTSIKYLLIRTLTWDIFASLRLNHWRIYRMQTSEWFVVIMGMVFSDSMAFLDECLQCAMHHMANYFERESRLDPAGENQSRTKSFQSPNRRTFTCPTPHSV